MAILPGVCCAFCGKFEKPDCPVKSASPWSRWEHWCVEYEKNSAYPEALTLVEAVRRQDAKEKGTPPVVRQGASLRRDSEHPPKSTRRPGQRQAGRRKLPAVQSATKGKG